MSCNNQNWSCLFDVIAFWDVKPKRSKFMRSRSEMSSKTCQSSQVENVPHPNRSYPNFIGSGDEIEQSPKWSVDTIQTGISTVRDFWSDRSRRSSSAYVSRTLHWSPISTFTQLSFVIASVFGVWAGKNFVLSLFEVLWQVLGAPFLLKFI